MSTSGFIVTTQLIFEHRSVSESKQRILLFIYFATIEQRQQVLNNHP